jgi:putative endopeptidase
MSLRSLSVGFASLPFLFLACGGDTQPPVTPSAPPPAVSGTGTGAAAAGAATPLPMAPSMTGLSEAEETSLDRAVSPCDNFFQFACGGWLKKTTIPDDESSWMRSFSVIHESNEAMLREILETKPAAPAAAKPTEFERVQSFYSACMDEPGIEKQGLAPLEAELAVVKSVRDSKTLATAVGKLHARGLAPLFSVGSQQDFADSTKMIGAFDQAGLGMPDRDYYLKAEGKFPELKKKYEEHVRAMFALLYGKSEVKAKDPAVVKRAEAAAASVLKLETKLAEKQMSKEDRRDPKKIYHLTDRAKLPGTFPWETYLSELPVKEVKEFNVAQVEYATAFGEFAGGIGKKDAVATAEDWQVYLTWNVMRAASPMLPKVVVDEAFRWQSTLRGAAKLPPRWKRCVRATDAAMGEALAQPFVAKTLGVDGKTQVREMIVAIEAVMKDNLDGLRWMDAKTRERAHKKLAKIANKIAYPDKWRSYDALKVESGKYYSNRTAANAFEQTRQLVKIGKPVDRNEWYMTPPTVNAYYDSSMNEMVFPAGILQPPFYSKAMPLAANFGGIGMVMGHELTHGFDDEGRQFDADGNLKDWWEPSVNAEFEKRAACVENQYSGYTVLGDTKVNGKLTLGENIADLGGVKLALLALRSKVQNAQTKQGEVSSDQRFFLGFAQGWCGKYRDEMMRLLVATNPHSPPELRVNGPLSNTPEFAQAFSCKPGHSMVRANRCEIW